MYAAAYLSTHENTNEPPRHSCLASFVLGKTFGVSTCAAILLNTLDFSFEPRILAHDEDLQVGEYASHFPNIACSKCHTFHSLLRALTRCSHPGRAETHPDCKLCVSDGFSCDGNLLSAFAPLHYPVPSYPCAMCPTASTDTFFGRRHPGSCKPTVSFILSCYAGCYCCTSSGPRRLYTFVGH